tara:strand:- start:583 stop:831 length:249 start_codon:yes stop_codon:yes gene_type:complete
MKWFLVFLMAQGPGEAMHEYYQLKDPTFSSEAECTLFIVDPIYNRMTRDHIKTIYPLRPVEQVYCIREDKWNQLTKSNEAGY